MPLNVDVSLFVFFINIVLSVSAPDVSIVISPTDVKSNAPELSQSVTDVFQSQVPAINNLY